jgi:hypothetical protein
LRDERLDLRARQRFVERSRTFPLLHVFDFFLHLPVVEFLTCPCLHEARLFRVLVLRDFDLAIYVNEKNILRNWSLCLIKLFISRFALRYDA